MTRGIVLCLAMVSVAAQAQQHPLVGVWQVSYPAGSRNENGVVTPIMATGVLTVEAVQDSLVATLVTDSGAEVPVRPPLRLATESKPGDAVFVSHTKATLNMNGETRVAIAVSTWTLGVKGDSLIGTVERALIGVEVGPQEPQPVVGWRRKQ